MYHYAASDVDFSNKSLDRNEARNKINYLASKGQPFVFLIDFEGESCFVWSPDEIDGDRLHFDFGGYTNAPFSRIRKCPRELKFVKNPVPYPVFLAAYEEVVSQILAGNSFLVNLTFESEIETNYSLRELYECSQANYKLHLDDKMVFFSPETFIKIRDGRISAFPMKGTIDAGIPEAREKILQNEKETAEHATIVDLIRNDLSMVANDVAVSRFRYIDKITTHEKELYQVSSEVTGSLPLGFQNSLGDIIFKLLPAGSITGAPKAKTTSIIRLVEPHDRGFYTGICGHFDGQNLDSGVMIRFIEKRGPRFFFKSGGGITCNSEPETEYQEYIDKIYVPIT
ncbi:UNVERIFIED_CONTAM: hypothetical protein GTU68_065796 [Idotea baltica]|nr:hypothetical protein [Idotea baltica]